MPSKQQAFHEWYLPDGSVWARLFRRDNGYVVRFPNYADFTISADGLSSDCVARPGVDEATLEHLYLNQIRPLEMSLQGALAFHGAAVEIPGAAAIAFLAATGRGKSTLAAAFAARGHAFLTDDMLILDRADPGYSVTPSHPSIRLFEDSRAAMLPAGTIAGRAVAYTSKQRYLASETLPHRSIPCRLRAAYFLGAPGASDIQIQPIIGAEGVPTWISHSFLMDINDREVLASHFDQIVELAQSVPAFRLDFPRRYDVIDLLVQKLCQHVGGLAEP